MAVYNKHIQDYYLISIIIGAIRNTVYDKALDKMYKCMKDESRGYVE